jgi:hypothetical protein
MPPRPRDSPESTKEAEATLVSPREPPDTSSGKGAQRIFHDTVVRVRPWASKSITDLLSASGYGYLVRGQSTRSH